MWRINELKALTSQVIQLRLSKRDKRSTAIGSRSRHAPIDLGPTEE